MTMISVDFRMAETQRAGLVLRNGMQANKLVRQNGKSNLLQNAKSDLQKPLVLTKTERPFKSVVTSKASFTVYEDQESPSKDTIDENNIIHQLERKCKEEQLKTKEPAQKANRHPLSQIQEINFAHRSDSEEDLYSARSYATDASVRNDLFNLNVTDTTVPYTSSSYQEDEVEECSSLPDETYHEECLYAAPQFSENIYEYMRSRETRGRTKPDFLRKQTEITKDMRHILIDWLSDVACEYNMSQETLHLGVSLLDRALSRFYIQRERLQLLGAATMMIAAKFEEVIPPETKDFVYLTDDTYTIDQLLSMERVVLKELGYKVSLPTAVWFANHLVNAANVDKTSRCAVEYLLDLTLVDPSYHEFKPSYVAASCVCYANVLCGNAPWNGQLEKHSGILLGHLSKICLKLHSAFLEAPESEHHAIYAHYAGQTKHEVSKMTPPKILPFNL